MDFFIDTDGVDLKRQVRRTKGKVDAVGAVAPVALPVTPQLPPPSVDYCGDLKPLINTVEARPTPPQPRGRQCLYFDLETIPDEPRQHLFGLDPLPELPPVIPYAELMTPEEFISQGLDEISKFVYAKNPDPSWLDEVAQKELTSKKPRKGLFDLVGAAKSVGSNAAAAKIEQRKKMSVTPEFCRIVAFGWAVGGGDVNSIVVDVNGDLDLQEKKILIAIWDLIKNCGPVVGFNILGFDMVVVIVRSIIHGIIPTRNFANVKPWDQSSIIDLMLCRFPKGGAMKLKALLRLYGIEPPAGECDGSQVEELARTDPEKLGEYVRSDVWLSRELHRKWMGYFTVS